MRGRLFRKIEKPVIECVLYNDEGYQKNIEKIFNHSDFNFFIINVGEALNKKIVMNLQKSMLANKDKIFYLEQSISKNMVKYENCVAFQKIHFDNLKETVLNENVEMFFLEFDVCKDYTDDDFARIKQKFTTVKSQSIFVLLSVSSQNVGLKNCIKIMEALRKMPYTVSLLPLFKETYLVLEHPCNAYMCQGENCHSHKSAYPRYLYITKEGITPYRVYNPRFMFFTDIDKGGEETLENIFAEYKNSQAYEFFLECNKKIYFDIIVPHVLEVLPWNVLIEYAFQEILEEKLNESI